MIIKNKIKSKGKKETYKSNENVSMERYRA